MGGVISEILYMGVVAAIAIPLIGGLKMSLFQIVLTVINTVLIIITYTSIFNLISMLCSEITISTIMCILVFIIMYIIASSLALVINTPEYNSSMYYDENGSHLVSQTINPNYPGKQKIKIAKTLYYFLPQGQANEIMNGKVENLSKFPFYSIGLISIINFSGIYFFNKKELK